MPAAKKLDTNDRGYAPRRYLPAESERDEMIDRARQAGMYPRNLSQAVDALIAGNGVRATARAVGISTTTATKLFAVLAPNVRPCLCGRPRAHSGWCAHRLAAAGLPTGHVAAGHARATRRARSQRTVAERAALVIEVNRIVPRFHDTELRAELTQEIFLAIAEERMTFADVPRELPALIRRARRGLSHPFVHSLDAPVPGTEDLKITLIANENQRWEDTDDNRWDDTHCFGCGERGFIRRVSGHWQCGQCGCIVETCCDL